MQPGDSVLFMKVGMHANEGLKDIIERKRAEIEAEGFALWGYGGNTCHPATMVRPFAAMSSGPIVLAMQPIKSNHFAQPVRAEEFSSDGVEWARVPAGINCVGSRYALLIDSLEETDELLDLGLTEVAVGASRGKAGSSYVRGRVDKACLQVSTDLLGESRPVHIGLRAHLIDPFAVFLRN